jgi:crossover junction endodeoxyribonuclease RuvC
MDETKRRILAVDPGTKQIGIAILAGTNLIFYCVKTVRDRSTARKILEQVATIAREMIAAYNPDYLAIEKMFIIQKSAALLSLAAEEMKSVARSCSLPVYEYAPTSIRKFICQNGGATKRDVAKVIAKYYPELSRHLNTRNKWEEQYYANVFDAMAVGLMCHENIARDDFPYV